MKVPNPDFVNHPTPEPLMQGGAIFAEVKRAEEFGELLYEMHRANLRFYDVQGVSYMRDWKEIPDQAKESWTATACEFLQHFSED